MLQNLQPSGILKISEDLLQNTDIQDSLERWDWAYYSEKLKKKLYDIDDEILKPYFSLENVENAIFDLATSLYGIRFVRNNINSCLSP